MSIERFTEKSIEAINRANEEARKRGLTHIGTDQLLLGLMEADNKLAGKVLDGVQSGFKQAREKVEEFMGTTKAVPPPEIPFSPKTKKIIERAWEEAKSRGCTEVSTEHLLLAITLEQGKAAKEALKPLGLDPDSLKWKLLKILGEASTKPSSADS